MQYNAYEDFGTWAIINVLNSHNVNHVNRIKVLEFNVFYIIIYLD